MPNSCINMRRWQADRVNSAPEFTAHPLHVPAHVLQYQSCGQRLSEFSRRNLHGSLTPVPALQGVRAPWQTMSASTIAFSRERSAAG